VVAPNRLEQNFSVVAPDRVWATDITYVRTFEGWLYPVIVHSDQGSQYGSDDAVRFFKDHGLIPSMSRRGNCFDNAVVESFFSSLKKERIRRRIYPSREEARADVFDYIEVFYNRIRRHSHLGQMSPCDFEQAALNQA
jgi:putative transposase